ncbi:hypothetical protein P691DRAFT_656211 [Macrolepiota fuliginosa MF-IS2]|uniref:G-patch domain-containing protein n=1 Tax=Macrolepiota fuliginosa MF-IS2 TaxID=1400762 RepID=A0A9P5XP44_9AGAR|nr:hypothetical protein P691DRAFT_656211 [Macrolepiota fuliginosa MF-IS2]
MSSSSRLKRKLGDLGVDVSSSKANESFCLIGTPLPPLEKSKDTGEFVPLWKQEVRDEKGRRRLHGAFTGGFSAGYFNTVGSQEGWAPSTFVSSRGDRAKAKAARPEDFMDEEDLQELRESRTIVDTTQEMDLTGGTAAELNRRQGADDVEQDSIVHALQSTLLPPPTDSAGARILKKMGWRLGNGIGPRVSLRQRKLQDLQASSPYGTRIVTDDVKITEDDEEANKYMYAPRDTPVLTVERRDNAHGLGYRTGMTLHESLGSSGQGVVKGPRIAAGFGLGALNDADEDDVDIYDADANTTRGRLAYDAQFNEDTSVGAKATSGKSKTRSTASTSSAFRDGTRVLTGFILSEKPVMEDRRFAFPDIPPGWRPDPQRVLEANKENIVSQDTKQDPMPHEKWKTVKMTADERGNLLGEAQINAGPRSIFDYLSEKDRERLKNIAAATAAGIPAAAAGSSIPRTEPHIAEAALKGFQPFTSDPVKQDRYITYLRSQVTPDDSIPSLQPLPDQRPDEFQKEVDDYAKAATIFKPVSGAMAGRFQTATHVEQGPKIHEGLHQPTAAELEELEAKRKKEEEEKISPQAHAAKLGMYGPMTREIMPWQPVRLLCKRFGLKEPELPADGGSTSAKGPSFTSSEAEDAFRQTADANFGAGTSSSSHRTQSETSSGARNLANVGLGEDETQGRDTLTYQRPAMDVFKAIFASDDEDSGDEKDDVEEPEPEVTKEEAPNGPAGPSHSLLDDKPVDLSTFKPTFIPREGKAKKTNDKDRSKEKKEEKKKKKKERKGPLVSFDVDEAGVEGLSLRVSSNERPKKKKKKDKGKREDDDDNGMWVEKPIPEVVKNLPPMPIAVVPSQHMEHPVPAPVLDDSNDANGTSVGVHRSRKRAIDFL